MRPNHCCCDLLSILEPRALTPSPVPRYHVHLSTFAQLNAKQNYNSNGNTVDPCRGCWYSNGVLPLKEKGKHENKQTYGETRGAHIKGLLSTLTGSRSYYQGGLYLLKAHQRWGVRGKKGKNTLPRSKGK